MFLILFVFFSNKVNLRLASTSKMTFKVYSIMLLLLFVGFLAALIMFYKLIQNFPHEIIMFFHEGLLLFLLLIDFAQIIYDFFLVGILKDAFHMFIIFGKWKFG